MNEQGNNQEKAPRRRGLTSVTLQWLAEKLRKAEKIKEELSQGTYRVDTCKVAKAILDGDADVG